MISINNLTVAFGGFTLLDDISFHVSPGEHMALVGKNGAGKSTILKLIAGLESPTSGVISHRSGLTVGYLPQIMEYSKDLTVMDAAMEAFNEHFTKLERLEKAQRELAERTDYESEAYSALIQELTDLSDYVAMAGGEPPYVRAEKTLVGLGFKKNELERPRNTFSQGWNMRLELAKVLLRCPDILLLDEPTNHLDIESIQWLEDYLHGYSGALMLISHDRRFLDRVTTRTVEIMLGRIYDYKVPYSRYKELRAEYMVQQMAAYENQQRMIAKTEEFIERFRYKPTKSNQVQSRIKALEKIERIELEVDDKATLAVKFPPAPRSGDVVFQARDVKAGYKGAAVGLSGDWSPVGSGNGHAVGRIEGKVVIPCINLEVRRGDKIAFVGRNGEGKSTMLKVILGELEPLAGEAKLGYNVDLGYYAQNQEDVLDKKMTVYDTLDYVAVGDIRAKLRDILGAFLFKGEDVDKKVAVLSGGERSRLAMAKLILHPYNLLLLDEPTNHMDIRSKDVLKEAINAFDGTVIVVSHDREFLDGLVTKVYEFGGGLVREHIGGIYDYLQKKQLDSLDHLSVNKLHSGTSASGRVEVKTTEAPNERKQSYEQQKDYQRRVRKAEKAVSDWEEKITAYEEKIAQLEERMSTPEGAADPSLYTEHTELKRQLDQAVEMWEISSAEWEEIVKDR
ncbi:MAG: ABC-F family ATP-binding cassette domain-containing protein [Bacteroidales bacterium]|nr:ABC-F family ATP-binding cassette domain-containing protein [Bacteroidales bacterium]